MAQKDQSTYTFYSECGNACRIALEQILKSYPDPLRITEIETVLRLHIQDQSTVDHMWELLHSLTPPVGTLLHEAFTLVGQVHAKYVNEISQLQGDEYDAAQQAFATAFNKVGSIG